MITSKGKEILAKYLVGQSPAYASHIAIGCGATPIMTTNTTDYSSTYLAKTELDFEIVRIPIISRGYTKENGVSNIVFTAELPTTDRYEITEVGIFSAGSNPIAADVDSKTILSFASSENWKNKTTGAAIPALSSLISSSNLSSTYGIFRGQASDTFFDDTLRLNRLERPRFSDDTIFIYDDDTSRIALDGVDFSTFSKASPNDALKLAFSVISKVPSTTATGTVTILVKFEEQGTSNYFQFSTGNITISDSSRYVVSTNTFSNLTTNGTPSWSRVNRVTIESNCSTNNKTFAVALDAMRFDNRTAIVPLYGLTGYTVVKNNNAANTLPATITKLSNSSNLIEFRFAMDVV